jgi:hypothetical protein
VEGVPSDHDAVETHRVTVSAVGRTDRPAVELPGAVECEAGDTCWFALDGTGYHARIERTLEDERVIKHVADNARLARRGEGENRLVDWVEAADVSLGGSAHFDVVTAGYAYGLRTPGSRVVYRAPDPPNEDLAAIAQDLEP